MIRHGATDWSTKLRHTGLSDIPLNYEGETQMKLLRSILERIMPTYRELPVIASPLKRARQTAELLGFSQITFVDDLVEWNYGEYEGLRSDEIRKQFPSWNLFRDGCPGGESLNDVIKRAQNIISIIKSSIQASSDLFLVSHGHFIRVLVMCALGFNDVDMNLLDLKASSLSALEMNLEHNKLLFWNFPSDLQLNRLVNK